MNKDKEESFRVRLIDAFSAIAEVIADGIEADEKETVLCGITYIPKIL
mgnify:CR=1 FL=1